MPLHGHVYTGISGLRGFDANTTITPAIAGAFAAHGYRFCVRYVRRDVKRPNDLTADEATVILDAGLALMPVQHVESEESWVANGAKGTANGTAAAEDATAIGIPAGVTLWCDLEGVAVETPAQDIIDYLDQWHSDVAGAGFVPGLYVGYHAGLNASQLYRSLRFTHYWAAYNLNADEAPAVRGVQMRQAIPKSLERVPGAELDFQVDSIRADALGGLPTLVGPDGWNEVA